MCRIWGWCKFHILLVGDKVVQVLGLNPPTCKGSLHTGFLPQSSEVDVRLNGDSMCQCECKWLFFLYVSPVTDWWFVQGVSRLLTYGTWGRLLYHCDWGILMLVYDLDGLKFWKDYWKMIRVGNVVCTYQQHFGSLSEFLWKYLTCTDISQLHTLTYWC